jgi:cellulose synthase operon protein C
MHTDQFKLKFPWQRFSAFFSVSLCLCVALAHADSLSSRTVPDKWIEPFLPEDEPEPFYPDYAQNDPVARAEIQINAGQYRRGLATLSKVDPKKTVILRAKSLMALGRFDEAMAILSGHDSEAAILRADVLGKMERYADAIALLQKIVAANPQSIAAHYELGWYLQQSGDYDGAGKAYQWFVDPPQDYLNRWRAAPHQFNDAQDVVFIGKALDGWATLTGAYVGDANLANTVLSMFTAAYNRIDTDFYPAHVAAAEYFVAHDDDDQALDELNQALGHNPHDIAALELAGKIAVGSFNFAAGEEEAAAIRDVDPDSVAADKLQARNLLQQRRPEEAIVVLDSILQRRPNDMESLGLLAGAQALLLHDAEMKQAFARADAAQPQSPIAYFEAAEQLSSMRQYSQAAGLYKTALARAPWSTAVRNGLGLLETQSGDEATARVVLEAAHAVDPFSVRSTNYLKLLDMMDGFARKESAHFIVTYDATQDPVIPEYFSDYLESIYTDVTGDFHYEPKVKTLIEVFPTHDAFSVRTTGAPWIATVGASTGRVIALTAPRESAGGAFNWARVVRHEFTHTVTLGATDNRIAHWFTEGLAVWEEHSPIPWEWVPMMYDAVSNDKLFPIENLTWAFIRPRKPIDRQLAYAESYWIVTYIEQKYGHVANLKLMEQEKLGRQLDDSFTAVFHENAEAFFKEFDAWAKQQIAGWGYDQASSDKYKQLVSEGEALIQSEDYAGAADKWRQIALLRPMDMLPHYKLMGVYLQLEDWDKAAEQLEVLSAVELKNNRYVKVLAKLYLKAGKLDLAHARALKAVYINPYDESAHEVLEKVDDRLGDAAGAQREQRVIDILNKLSSNNTNE